MGTVTQDTSGAQIPQFYAKKAIFITGASGFMGKVLIERLLSTCPDVGRLYLLMRTKQGVVPDERLLELKQSQVFDVVRERCPRQLDKLVLIPGDITQPQLGISQEFLMQLQEVSVVFHSAATLKFDESLRAAVDQNVRSLMRLLDICDRLPNLQVVVHVSTAYSNAELQYVEERVYDAPAPLHELLSLVNSVPPHLLNDITPRYIHPKPNTYTFTKAIAETVMSSRERRYSAAIFRPTIVVSSLRDPFPGWIEKFNGPTGVIAAVGLGLLSVIKSKNSMHIDLIPVDIAIDTLLAVGWETAVDKCPEVRVYNCGSKENPLNMRHFVSLIEKSVHNHPTCKSLWYPTHFIIENSFLASVLQFLLQTLPLHLAAYAMRLLGIKTKMDLIEVEKKQRSMTTAYNYFLTREWHFDNSNVRRLRARLSADDTKIYNLDPKSIKNWEQHIQDFTVGVRKYLIREKDEDLPAAKKHLRRLKYLHYAVRFFILLVFSKVLLQTQFVKVAVYEFFETFSSLFFPTNNNVVE